MVKYTQTIWRQQVPNCLSVFGYFSELVLKGLILELTRITNHSNTPQDNKHYLKSVSICFSGTYFQHSKSPYSVRMPKNTTGKTPNTSTFYTMIFSNVIKPFSPCWAGDNPELLSDSNISKMVRLNTALTATFFKKYSTNFLMVCRLIDFAFVVLKLLMFKVRVPKLS